MAQNIVYVMSVTKQSYKNKLVGWMGATGFGVYLCGTVIIFFGTIMFIL